jgi:hypothetical protein
MLNIINEKISSLSGGKIKYEKERSSDSEQIEKLDISCNSFKKN